MKKILFVLFVVVLSILISLFNPKINIDIYANELDEPIELEDDEPYVYVYESNCFISISSGTAYVDSQVTGKPGTTSTSVTVHLEKLVNGSWEPYTSWYHSGGKSQNNTDSTNVAPGAYRVWMSVTASDGNGSESFNVDGNTMGYWCIFSGKGD